MKIYVATARETKSGKTLLEGYRNRKKDGNWVKEYCSATIPKGVPVDFYVGTCVDVIWDRDMKSYREK